MSIRKRKRWKNRKRRSWQKKLESLSATDGGCRTSRGRPLKMVDHPERKNVVDPTPTTLASRGKTTPFNHQLIIPDMRTSPAHPTVARRRVNMEPREQKDQARSSMRKEEIREAVEEGEVTEENHPLNLPNNEAFLVRGRLARFRNN